MADPANSDAPAAEDNAVKERPEVAAIRDRLPGAFISAKERFGQTFICVKRDMVVPVVLLLKETPELQYDYFSECMGVDYSKYTNQRDLDTRFEVVYNLMSLQHASRILLKVGVNDGETVPTLKHTFAGAEFPEREIWDLFGIVFEGNEQTQRFLLPDDWVGFPLRKEYPLGGEDVLFDRKDRGPEIGQIPLPHAGESFEGKTGSKEISGR